MKKQYILPLAIACLAFVGTQAQRVATVEKTLPVQKHHVGEKNPCDTIFSTINNWAQPTIFGVSQQGGGGWVGGHNGYGDKQKAQQFLNTWQNGVNIEGTVLWFGAKRHNSGNPNSKITVHAYTLNGTGSASSGSVSCPNSKVKSADLLISAVDTGSNWNIVMFPSAQYFPGDFAVGIDLTPTNAGDSVGLVSSEDGGALYTDMAWEQWSDNTWWTTYEPNNWNLNIDWAIFPIYCEIPIGLHEEAGFVKGIRFSTAPNPAQDQMLVTYELQEAGETHIELRDLTGKTVLVINEGMKDAGKYTLQLELSSIAPGSYLAAVKQGNRMMVQKVNVIK